MYIPLFLLGLVFGVILNGLADNLPPDDLGLTHGPGAPRCRYCGATYGWRHWLVLTNFLLAGGRCDHCGAPRRLRHLVVELAAGLSLPLLWSWSLGGVQREFLPAAVIVLACLLITVIDIEHRLILWNVIFPAVLVIGLLEGLSRGWAMTLSGGLAGYLVMGVFFLLGQLFSVVVALVRRMPLDEIAFGGGDVNLGGLVGLAVGWPQVLFALTIGVFASGFFSIGYIVVQLIRGRYTPYAAIPYGPFLVLGALAIYLYGPELVAWYFTGAF